MHIDWDVIASKADLKERQLEEMVIKRPGFKHYTAKDYWKKELGNADGKTIGEGHWREVVDGIDGICIADEDVRVIQFNKRHQGIVDKQHDVARGVALENEEGVLLENAANIVRAACNGAVNTRPSASASTPALTESPPSKASSGSPHGPSSSVAPQRRTGIKAAGVNAVVNPSASVPPENTDLNAGTGNGAGRSAGRGA